MCFAQGHSVSVRGTEARVGEMRLGSETDSSRNRAEAQESFLGPRAFSKFSLVMKLWWGKFVQKIGGRADFHVGMKRNEGSPTF